MYSFNTIHQPTDGCFWQRAIVLVDMNAFFAAIEQMDFPQLRGKPIAVTNGDKGSCIITSSYEARAYGVKTGMRFYEAQKICPHLLQCPSRPQRYAEISKKIMQILYEITPDIEIFSVDEAFLDVTRCQQLWGTPEEIGRLAQNKIYTACGLPCSIGISGDKTTAKYAAELVKPHGFTVIPPWEAKARLRDVPVTHLCGIGEGIGLFLARHGVFTCGDMEKLSIHVLSKRFGNLGRRIWYMCQGADPEPVNITTAAPKSMGHGKVLPPHTVDCEIIKTYFQHMSEKLAARLRRHHMKAKSFFIGMRTDQMEWLGGKAHLLLPTQDGQKIYQLCLQTMETYWQQQPLLQVQVTAQQPSIHFHQLDFFAKMEMDVKPFHQAIDTINKRYGEFTIAPAKLLKRTKQPDVLAPAWRPNGHRESV